ncbi:3-deoxy-manno-octulosonate cytidylyltransferase (CMP-KDO synthetase) [Pedobacter cryoconitis]|uniref:3-deoxy-manno-octulosonate cytidylyltransferase n=1 Tax=Pedobacter cryoconitis TaxID=188932 RepID=A0A7W9E1B0_9SPHI|nr:3-deoxy-manno-octulosonate cytidylyltransferase [Pedobacter cryoconitis]MBB5638828.1 3-deoxy-manno-octulosonate cytidylyltransferase (CMP-KDO synthetase) [Pedobacter cryoconitis]
MAKLGIIPARYASTRFPGKPLIDINGKSMIQRVYEQACSSASLDKVVIATDDDRIIAEIKRFGGEYAKTRPDHQSGTDRCAEVAENFRGFDVIINIQGDEPYIDPVQIDLLSSCFQNPKVELATLVKKISSEEELFNQNIPKVVLNSNQEAIYFSRQTIPFIRTAAPQDWLKTFQFYKHIGIYGYTTETLLKITKLKPSSLEVAESLEQLRWLENGYKIQTKVTDLETIAVDTPEDLDKIIRIKGN